MPGSGDTRFPRMEAYQLIRATMRHNASASPACGPGKNPADRVPVLIVRRRGRRGDFAAAHDFAEVLGLSLGVCD